MVKVFRPNQTSSKSYQQTQGKLNGAQWNRTMRENCKNVFISQGPSTAESQQFTQVRVLQRDSNQDSFKRCERDIQGGGVRGGQGSYWNPIRELCGQSLWENQWLWQRYTHSQPAGRDYPEKTYSPPPLPLLPGLPVGWTEWKLEGRWFVGVHTGHVSGFRELVDGESGRETRRATQQTV